MTIDKTASFAAAHDKALVAKCRDLNYSGCCNERDRHPGITIFRQVTAYGRNPFSGQLTSCAQGDLDRGLQSDGAWTGNQAESVTTLRIGGIAAAEAASPAWVWEHRI
jgi:hypothetical protein